MQFTHRPPQQMVAHDLFIVALFFAICGDEIKKVQCQRDSAGFAPLRQLRDLAIAKGCVGLSLIHENVELPAGVGTARLVRRFGSDNGACQRRVGLDGILQQEANSGSHGGNGKGVTHRLPRWLLLLRYSSRLIGLGPDCCASAPVGA